MELLRGPGTNQACENRKGKLWTLERPFMELQLNYSQHSHAHVHTQPRRFQTFLEAEEAHLNECVEEQEHA